MNPSGKPDKNLQEFYESHSGTPGNPRVYNFGVLDGNRDDYTGVIKATSGAHDIVINVEEIIGAIETHIDFNALAKRIVVNCKKFTNVRSEYISSIKGGCEDCEVHGPVYGPLPSKGVHHIDGNWSDQSSAITRGTRLGLVPADGSPAKYQALNSAGVAAVPPARAECTFGIPGGRRGIAGVWFLWGLLKKWGLA